MTQTNLSKMVSIQETSQEKLDRRVIRFVIDQNQANSVVDTDSFRELVLGAPGASDNKVMCRQTLVKRITEKFQQMACNLRAELKAAPYICIVADIWTSTSRSFLGVTGKGEMHWY